MQFTTQQYLQQEAAVQDKINQWNKPLLESLVLSKVVQTPQTVIIDCQSDDVIYLQKHLQI